MRKVLFTLLMVWLVVFLAVPVSAAKPEPVGEKISLWTEDPMVFPAGKGFHIAHGWSIDPTAGYPVAQFVFQLKIDDLVEPDFVRTQYTQGAVEPLMRLWVYNFPEGMLGQVEFRGYWSGPCGYLTEYGEYPGPCPDPFGVVTIVRQRTVVFKPAEVVE